MIATAAGGNGFNKAQGAIVTQHIDFMFPAAAPAARKPQVPALALRGAAQQKHWLFLDDLACLFRSWLASGVLDSQGIAAEPARGDARRACVGSHDRPVFLCVAAANAPMQRGPVRCKSILHRTLHRTNTWGCFELIHDRNKIP